MKYSWNWLAELAELPLSEEELLARLPFLGFEVASVERLGAAFTNVVVGEVLKVEKHPNAERLSLCEVTDGTRTFAIVCGAKNVAAGQRVPVALVGASLPGGLRIERAKIRGAESNGMICSGKELGLSTEANGIMVLDHGTPLGVDAAALLSPKDTVFELEITPNRADVLSHYGLARELAASIGARLKDVPSSSPSRPPLQPGPWGSPPGSPRPQPSPTSGRGSSGEMAANIKVSIDDPACTRYVARAISGVKVGPSPAWLARRLTLCGLRPINNVVDVTNYVLLELGQPLHAFDRALLSGGVRARRAAPGEAFKALDGKTYALEASDLVIADDKRAVALAGVIGGAETAVGDATTEVLLEAAHFDPGSVRRAARRLRLRTDSSYRFERGVDSNAVSRASERAAALIVELGGGSAAAPVDVYPRPRRPAEIVVDRQLLGERLGMELSRPAVEGALTALARPDGSVESRDGGWAFTPPGYRLDVVLFEDVAEEVARLVGYDKIPAEARPAAPSPLAKSPVQAWADRMRDKLTALGFCEAYSYDFVSAKELRCLEYPGFDEASLDRSMPRLENPTSADWVYLRPSLAHGLLRALARNVNRGASTALLFETGRVYSSRHEFSMLAGLLSGSLPAGVHWQHTARKADIFTVKGVIEALFHNAGRLEFERPTERNEWLHPKLYLGFSVDGRPAGRLGQLHPAAAARWEVPETWYFELLLDGLPPPPAWARQARALSSYPTSSRDISAFVAESLEWIEAAQAVRAAAGKELLALELVDVFAGEGVPAGKKSLTLRITLGAFDRTLSEAEIQAAVERVGRALESLGAELRK